MAWHHAAKQAVAVLNAHQAEKRRPDVFKKVVFGTDGSEGADHALALAEQLSNEDGEVIVVHCTELTMPGKGGGRFPIYANEDELKAKIEQQVADLSRNGRRVSLQTGTAGVGEAAEVIAAVAKDNGADAIVVGTRGRGALKGLFLGSVTQRLIHVAPCPVVVVPPDQS
jgi:nucleotide-binding universal stress UspA family protein